MSSVSSLNSVSVGSRKYRANPTYFYVVIATFFQEFRQNPIWTEVVAILQALMLPFCQTFASGTNDLCSPLRPPCHDVIPRRFLLYRYRTATVGSMIYYLSLF